VGRLWVIARRDADGSAPTVQLSRDCNLSVDSLTAYPPLLTVILAEISQQDTPPLHGYAVHQKSP